MDVLASAHRFADGKLNLPISAKLLPDQRPTAWNLEQHAVHLQRRLRLRHERQNPDVLRWISIRKYRTLLLRQPMARRRTNLVSKNGLPPASASTSL
jgi:hypothetical protein